MRVEKIKGLISLTLALEKQERDSLYRLSEEELVEISRGQAEGILPPALVREVAVGYDGENIQVMISL